MEAMGRHIHSCTHPSWCPASKRSRTALTGSITSFLSCQQSPVQAVEGARAPLSL